MDKKIGYPTGKLKTLYTGLKTETDLDAINAIISELTPGEARSLLYAYIYDALSVQRPSAMPTEKNNVVVRLEAYRISHRLTLKALAEDMNLPLTTVSSWLQGANNPSETSISIIENYLLDRSKAE